MAANTNSSTRQIKTQVTGRNVDEFQSGMWPYDKDQGNRGTISRARFLAWKWPNSKSNSLFLFFLLWVRPENETNEVGPIHYQAGFLPAFNPQNKSQLTWGHVPTKDGADVEYPQPAGPADFDGDLWDMYEALGNKEDVANLTLEEDELEDYAGYNVTGKGPLPKMDYTQLLESIAKSGYEDLPFADCRELEGLDCHFVWEKRKYGQDKRKKTADDAAVAAGGTTEEPKDFMVPVVVDIFNLKEAGNGLSESASSTTLATPETVAASTSAASTAAKKSTSKKTDPPKNPINRAQLAEDVYQFVSSSPSQKTDLKTVSNAMLAKYSEQMDEVFVLMTGKGPDHNAFWTGMELVKMGKGDVVRLTDKGVERYEEENEVDS